PWIIGGDFNAILHLQERTGQNDNRLTSLNDFGDMITNRGFIDAGYEGSCFTWTNYRVWKRLDIILYSKDWLNLFQTTKVTHLPRIWSDHSPLLISTCFKCIRSVPSFRFLKMWTRHYLFLEAVEK
ncbi:hypothetical protein Pfo_027379, partial [Paulownia fortunei]